MAPSRRDPLGGRGVPSDGGARGLAARHRRTNRGRCVPGGGQPRRVRARRRWRRDDRGARSTHGRLRFRWRRRDLLRDETDDELRSRSRLGQRVRRHVQRRVLRLLSRASLGEARRLPMSLRPVPAAADVASAPEPGSAGVSMIGGALMAPLALATALSVPPVPEFPPSAASSAADPSGPVDSVMSVNAPAMVACESGGIGAPDCEVNCRIVLLVYTSDCKVSCRSGFFACCNCATGCKCLLDHDEMWPAPPAPDPPPGP